MKYERMTIKTPDCFAYDLKDFEHKPREFNDYDAFFAYAMAVKRLGELEEQIENGELVFIHDHFIQEETILDGKTRYLVCNYVPSLVISEFFDDKAQAEKYIEELEVKP